MNRDVDPEQIRRYLAGELDNKAMHALEKRALDDPFLADALEGFAGRRPDQRVHLADLTKRLETRLKQNEKAIFTLNYRWLAAAGVLLVVVVGLLWTMQLRNGKESTLAQVNTTVSDSSITDTLQYFNREEPVAWGKTTPEKPLAVSIPSDTALLARRKNRSVAAPVAAEVPTSSAMMGREEAANPPVALHVQEDSVGGRLAVSPVASAPKDIQAAEMTEKVAAAYSPRVTTRLIQGRVTASSVEGGLPGAAVSIEGTGKGVVTDKEGNFSIRVADTTKDLKLVVAALGFGSQRMDLDGKDNNLDITLKKQENALSDVVVTSYGTKKRAKVKAEVYQLPAPVIGYEGYREYLSKNVRYPGSAAAGNITGKVRVSARVMPDGTLEDVRITRRLQPDCDAEALRVVKEGPEWKPASDGKATRVQIDVSFAPK